MLLLTALSLPFAHTHAGGLQKEGECSPVTPCGCMVVLGQRVEYECWVPRGLRVAGATSLYWGHWRGLFRGFLLALLLSIQVCFCPGCSLRFPLNLWAPRGKASYGGLWVPEWQDLCQLNIGSCLYGHITCMKSTIFVPKTLATGQSCYHPQSIPSAICSPVRLPESLGTQARAPSTFSGTGEPPVLWASQVWGTHLTACVSYQTFPISLCLMTSLHIGVGHLSESSFLPFILLRSQNHVSRLFPVQMCREEDMFISPWLWCLVPIYWCLWNLKVEDSILTFCYNLLKTAYNILFFNNYRYTVFLREWMSLSGIRGDSGKKDIGPRQWISLPSVPPIQTLTLRHRFPR